MYCLYFKSKKCSYKCKAHINRTNLNGMTINSTNLNGMTGLKVT